MKRAGNWTGIWGLALALSAPGLDAQPNKPPTSYTVVETNSMMGVPVTQAIYRDGAKVVVDVAHAAPGGAVRHSRTFYDLNTHRSMTWSTDSASAPCGISTFPGDWGDPFAAAAEISRDHPKPAGTATVNGLAATIVEPTGPGHAKVRAWIENRYGMLVKMEVTGPDGKPRTILEVTRLAAGPPPPTMMAVPAACAKAAAASPPAPPTEADLVAAETGDRAANFADATMPPGKRSTAACNVALRVLKAGSMTPIGRVQVAMDRHVDLQHPANYETSVDRAGHATFAGGSLRDLTSLMRNGVLLLNNVPENFEMAAVFGNAGETDALIYRQCPAPTSVLLLVVKNPEKISDGVRWLWAKSGKYAAAPAPPRP